MTRTTGARPPLWRRYGRFWGPDVGADVDDELRFHIEMRVAEYVARGMTSDDARRRALARFGEPSDVRGECLVIGHRRQRAMRRIELFRGTRQNLRLAVRRLLRDRLATVVALLCLALGVGVTTTVFSVANTLLVRPLPFPNGERLVSVGSARHGGGTPTGVSSYEDFVDWRDRQRSFSSFGAEEGVNVTLLAGGEAVRVPGARVTSGVFPALGVRAERGRLFAASDDAPGAPRVVVVSRGLADRVLGGADRVVGTQLRLSGTAHTVVGVLDERSRFPESAELWLPMRRTPVARERGSRSLQLFGALRPGVGVAEAQRDLDALVRRMAAENPDHDADLAVTVRPLRERYVGAARPAFRLLAAAALLLFAVACANVATLQLARATARAREIAVRAALGGGPGRIVGQLLTESVLLGVTGGLLGVWVAVAGSGLLAKSVAADLPPWMTFEVDGQVLAFTLAVSTLAGVAFGLAPALRLVRGDTVRPLRAGGRSGSGLDLTRGRLYRGLVVAEVALSLVLLAGAALTVESFRRLQRLDPGVTPAGAMTFRVSMQGERYESFANRAGFAERIAERLHAIPGVTAAGATTYLPVGGCCSQFGLTIDGQPEPQGAGPMVTGSQVTPDYFRAVGTPLVRGRAFTSADVRAAPRVAVVSETFVSRFAAGHDPLGLRFRTDSGDPWTVVGVVRDVKQGALTDAPEPQFYVPHAQDPWETITFVVRSTGQLVPAARLREVVRAEDPALPVFGVLSMPERLARATAAQRLYGLLFAGFAAVALVLAVTGVYGVMAYYVARRTGELAVRVALGADRRAVAGLVLRQGALTAAAGIALGTVGAVGAGRVLARVLYGVRAEEPGRYVALAAVLGVAVLAASWAPARRAGRVAPMGALRGE